MNKFDFLTGLRAKLWSLPHSDVERTADYYAEMIDDRMEEGLTEEEAVAAIGDLDEVVKNILAETPTAPTVVEMPKQRRGLRGWEILLLVLGSPVWIPLLIAVAAVTISVYIVLWSAVISLYAAAIGLGASAVGCVVGSIFMVRESGGMLIALGAALLCAGLAILVFMVSNLTAKGMVALTKRMWKGMKCIFAGKERTV